MTDELLRTGPIKRLYFSYALPAVLGMLVSGVYIVVDGIFIGHKLGGLGLAAMNFAYPVYSLLVALGLLLGIGASALISRARGAGEMAAAESFLGSAFIFLLLLALILSIGGALFLEELMVFLGAEGEALDLATDYISVVLSLSLFVLLATAFDHFLRNDGFPKLAMGLMMLGAGMNIILDAWFVLYLDWGLAGAAWATIISQVVIAFFFLSHFRSNKANVRLLFKGRTLSLARGREIFLTGLPAFIVEVSIALMIIFHNREFMRYGELIDVSAYGIVGYIITIFIMVNIGLGNGMQPITSFNFGAGNMSRVWKTFRLALTVNLLFGIFGVFILFFYPERIISVFMKADPLLLEVTKQGLFYYLPVILFTGMNMCMALFFISIGKKRLALWASLFRSNLYLYPLLFTLPLFLDKQGIWLANPLAEFLALLTVGLIVFKEKKKMAADFVKKDT